MNGILRTGLWILGLSVLALFATPIAGGSWGPCGPSNPFALILLLIGLLGIPGGAIVSIVGFVIHRNRLAQPNPESH